MRNKKVPTIQFELKYMANAKLGIYSDINIEIWHIFLANKFDFVGCQLV